MFSTATGTCSNEIRQETLHQLTPRYSKLPPFISDAEKQKLVDNARVYWKNRDLSPSNNADIIIKAKPHHGHLIKKHHYLNVDVFVVLMIKIIIKNKTNLGKQRLERM